MKTYPKFRFRARRISGRGEGRVSYLVDDGYFYLGYIEGSSGAWYDEELLMDKNTRGSAPSYKTRKKAAEALVRRLHGEEVPVVSRYTKPNTTYGTLMTVVEFRDSVENGWLTDYDGSGCASNGTHYDPKLDIYPSKIENIPTDATHIIWYNR